MINVIQRSIRKDYVTSASADIGIHEVIRYRSRTDQIIVKVTHRPISKPALIITEDHTSPLPCPAAGSGDGRGFSPGGSAPDLIRFSGNEAQTVDSSRYRTECDPVPGASAPAQSRRRAGTAVAVPGAGSAGPDPPRAERAALLPARGLARPVRPPPTRPDLGADRHQFADAH